MLAFTSSRAERKAANLSLSFYENFSLFSVSSRFLLPVVLSGTVSQRSSASLLNPSTMATTTNQLQVGHRDTKIRRANLPLLPVRVLLLTILCSHLSSVTSALPISSIPASAPGFWADEAAPGPAPAPASAVHDSDSLSDSWLDTVWVPDPDSEEGNDDDNWDLEYEDLATTDDGSPSVDDDVEGSVVDNKEGVNDARIGGT